MKKGKCKGKDYYLIEVKSQDSDPLYMASPLPEPFLNTSYTWLITNFDPGHTLQIIHLIQ